MQPTTASPARWRESFVALGREGAVMGIAGLVTGVIVAGVGGRLLMRIAAVAAPAEATGALTEAGNTVGDITFAGTTSFVLIFGFFAGVMGAVLYFIADPWLPSGRWARRGIRPLPPTGGERPVRHSGT